MKTIFRSRIFNRLIQASLWVPFILGLAMSIYANGGNLLSAQSTSEETLKVDVNLVTVGVLATDAKGREIPGMRSQDFSILENGHSKTLSFFSAETSCG